MQINYRDIAVFKKQLRELISTNNNLELTKLQNLARQGYLKWKGTLKSRDNNLKRAIRKSIKKLSKNNEPLSDKNIILNLWCVNENLNEFKWIIQEIKEGHTKEDSYVYWIDQRGSERTNNFNSIHKMIKSVLSQLLLSQNKSA